MDHARAGFKTTLRRRAYDLLRAGRLASPITLFRKGLRDSGWRRSNRVGAPVDAEGRPVPWYTYAAINFLQDRLPPDLRVFEYGTGNSTLWYSGRVAEVVAVEHDEKWARSIADAAPQNVRIVLQTDEHDYAEEIARHDGPFDVVVIDSLYWRVTCARQAVGHLTERGVVIWDNSDRADFRRAFHELHLFAGFKELPLFGLGPCGGTAWTTSILYRDGNCIGI